MRGKAGRMTRLIDADALMRAVMAQDVVDKSVAKRLIIQAPTVDAVIPVRCKDCKYWERKDGLVIGYCGAAKHGYKSTNWDIGIYRMTMDTGYCSEGERKNDA